MTTDRQSFAAEEIDEQLLWLLERYQAALASGETWDTRATEGLTETQRMAWEAATLSLRALARDRARGGEGAPREATAYLPTRIGRYEIERIIGVGGFSIVYLGHDAFIRRQAAVKIPRPHVLLSPELRERFVREAQAAAKLDHPHIVAIYEAGLDGELPYIAYAFSDGPTLGEWVRQTLELLPARQAAKLVRMLAEAIQYSHQRGILHRDLTPNNVLLTQRPPTGPDDLPFTPKISDFGLAKLIESDAEETASSVFMGTPAFMAPEQAVRGHKTSGVMVDVYGLGAILYFLLTGRAPFVRETPLETLAALRESAPVAPRVLRPAAPRDLEIICLTCLEKDPARRYQSADQLADDLGRYLSGIPILARPASPVRLAWQWCRRHPTVASLMTAVFGAVCLLVVGLIFYTIRVQEFGEALADQNERLRATISERDEALVERKKSQNLAESRATDLRHTLYTTEVGRAAAAWQRGDVQVMVDTLEPYRRSTETEPDLREFAWRYLWSQNGVREVFRMKVPQSQYTARFSPDQTVAAFAGADSTIRLVSTTDYRLVREIDTGQKEINFILFGPQGDWLATAGDDGTVAVFDFPSCRKRHVWPVLGHQKSYQLAWRAKENLLIVCGPSPDIQLLDFGSGETAGWLRGKEGNSIEALVVSPDEKLLLTCEYDWTAGIWDLDERKLRHKLTGFEQPVGSGVWSPDSRRVATGSNDNKVTVWDAETGGKLSEVVLLNSVQSLISTPEGLLLAGDSKGSINALDVPSFRGEERPALPPIRWPAHQHRIEGFAASRDGRLLATGSRDLTIGLFERQDAVPVRRRDFGLPNVYQRHSARTSAGPDRLGRMYSVSDAGIRVCRDERAESHDLLLPAEELSEVDWLDDTLYASSLDGRLFRWSTNDQPEPLETLQVVTEVEAGRNRNWNYSFELLSSDRILILTGSSDAGVWNLNERRFERFWPAHSEMAVDRRRNRFAFSRNADKVLLLFDAVTLDEMWSGAGHIDNIKDVKFGPGGRYLYTGGEDRSIRMWDIDAKREVFQFRGHETGIQLIAVSPDERTLTSADESGSVRLWDLRTGRELFELLNHDRTFRELAFTADGAELIGIDNDYIEFRWSSCDATLVLQPEH